MAVPVKGNPAANPERVGGSTSPDAAEFMQDQFVADLYVSFNGRKDREFSAASMYLDLFRQQKETCTRTWKTVGETTLKKETHTKNIGSIVAVLKKSMEGTSWKGKFVGIWLRDEVPEFQLAIADLNGALKKWSGKLGDGRSDSWAAMAPLEELKTYAERYKSLDKLQKTSFFRQITDQLETSKNTGTRAQRVWCSAFLKLAEEVSVIVSGGGGLGAREDRRILLQWSMFGKYISGQRGHVGGTTAGRCGQ